MSHSMNGNFELYKQTLCYDAENNPYLCLAQPWWVQTRRLNYPPRFRGKIEPLICGERVFQQISDDIKSAKHSVDIITWGFDPGMVLVRGKKAEEGQRFGDLLMEVAHRQRDPVQVRLLVWYDGMLAQKLMKNIPGHYGKYLSSVGNSTNGYYSTAHQNYNANWFTQVCAWKLRNISFRVRSVPLRYLPFSLAGESLPLSIDSCIAALYCTHHQKMLLIDYEHPKSSIGYVMGHNSTTDFWDTEKHLFRDPRRELIYKVDPAEEMANAYKACPQISPDTPRYSPSEYEIQEQERAFEAYIKNNRHVAKPYQDVSIRLRGPVLYDLNQNFCEAWLDSGKTNPANTSETDDQIDHDFIKKRRMIDSSAFIIPGERHSAQLLRTQPMYYEKSIKECYANLTRQINHYIFIQNQYVQYEPWAVHLKECVQRLRRDGYMEQIYVFILTSTPEKDGMDLPTYDVASKIGQSKNMVQEHAEALKQARLDKKVRPITPEEMAKQGINVVMGSLWTCALGKKLKADDYEEIYIHAKVAIVDDAAFTIGSANLNLRSMALDSELNILSEAQDVAYKLRADLFLQCTGATGPAQFKDMAVTFEFWKMLMSDNKSNKKKHRPLRCQLLQFHVDRKPGSPVV